MKVETLEKSHTPLWRSMAPILAGLAFGLTPMLAIAQDDPETDEEQEAPDVERMTVTGTRLQTNANVVAPNPVLTVGQEEVDARGTSRIEDLTNQLPQVFAGQASEVSNGATGTASLNLRGLGAIRTLPLIDGRRLPFGSSGTSAPDINLVPTQLVERLEIVTGGASAVYGSDAIAGVANFILKDDYEGVEIEMQGGFHQAGNDRKFFENVLEAAQQPVPGSTTDGRELRVSITMGANTYDGRGNVTAFFNYENLNQITQDNRVESACALGASSGEFSFGGVGCVGSSNFRRFFGLATGTDRFQEESGELVPFVGGPQQTFNFGPFNFFQRPTERFQMYSKGKYELTDDIELFADFSYVNTSSDAQIAPSASFGFWETNCNNPLLQTQEPITLSEVFGCVPDPETGAVPDEVPIFASHRNVEGGPRNSNIDLTTWRTVGGLRGTLFENYDFELFGQFARTLDQAISTNDFVIDNVQDAFFVVEDENGNPVCRSGNSGCVPYNIFQRGPNGESLVTADARNYVEGIGITTGETQQIVFGGNIQTDLTRFGVQSPFADNGMGVLAGWEFRQDELVSEPDQISQQPDGGFTGVGGPTLPVSGQVEVVEAYMEAQVPLVSDAPLMEQLAVGGAYRYSDYTTEDETTENTFDTDTWHVFLNWTPVEDLRLRGQFQRAVRAPNVIELFTPQGTNLPNLTSGPNGFFDPCAGPNPSATLEECARTGVTPDQFGSIPDVISGQTQSITGGNPFLDPEESDTITIGAILTPAFADGLTISVDYFDIQVDDAISAGIPAQTILDECIATGESAFCGLINRDRVGSLIAGTPGVGFQATNINIATLETTGLDFQVVYDLDLWDVGLDGLGSVRFDYASTYLDELSTTPFPGADPIQCEGKVAGSCGSPNPEYRHRMLTTWTTPWDIRVNAIWRYFSSTDNAQGSDVQPTIDRKIDTVQYLDLSVDYDFSENLSFRAGVNNVIGSDTPVVTSAGPALGNGNTYPTVFDATGRFFFFGATYSL
ncbi:MAG: TonB-dependent receptor [Wenzhouxiangellaceae bacterium]|nr:TonB-dependent receptor [Wenzhouxiangellaceae bacterium]MBS3822317.1 TonB-dependent receptor [Wenzhouxiangellaceae bacterium]